MYEKWCSKRVFVDDKIRKPFSMGPGWIACALRMSNFDRSSCTGTAIQSIDSRIHSCSRVGIANCFRISVPEGMGIANPIGCPKNAVCIVERCQRGLAILLLPDGGCKSWKDCSMRSNITYGKLKLMKWGAM